MILVGALLGKTADGFRSVDGCCSIYKDGTFVYSLPEERITRVKYDGGFSQSLKRGLTLTNTRPQDVDAFVFASYGEPVAAGVDHILEQEPSLRAVSSERLFIAPSHHYLHALYAFRHSSFSRALILVADNEGLIIGPRFAGLDLKDHHAERISYYVGYESRVELLKRNQVAPGSISLGEAYRKFTYYLGFPSHQFAGKTMALAAYGDRFTWPMVNVFTLNEFNDIQVDLRNDIGDPVREVQEFFNSHGLTDIYPRQTGGPIEEFHKHIAAVIQRELENILLEQVGQLLDDLKLRNLCIAGGVAYNCQLISFLEKHLGVKVFVPPSPGDQGLSLGAVQWFLEEHKRDRSHHVPTAFLGGDYDSMNLDQALEVTDRAKVQVVCDEQSQCLKLAVDLLRIDKVVGLCYGPSECGRRALGHRSLICLPTSEAALQSLKACKNREWFRPFGISVLASFAEKIFADPLPDPFMLRVSELQIPDDPLFDKIIHGDGTIRAQLVSDTSDDMLAALLRSLSQERIPPIVVNTSFNMDGGPIVETPDEAFELFIRYPIDALFLKNKLYLKNSS